MARQVVDLEEQIKILKADWTYLNAPQRLKRLAVEVLGMQPAQINQIRSENK